MESFIKYLTPPNGMSFREVINELTDLEIEERVQDYMQQQFKFLNLPVVIAMLPSDEEIKQQMTTEHYCHDKGRYRKIKLDRIQGGKMIRDLIKQRIEGNLL